MLIVTLHNDGTGPDEAANYDYRVYVNSTLIGSGRVEDHDRTQAWPALLKRVAEEALDKR